MYLEATLPCCWPSSPPPGEPAGGPSSWRQRLFSCSTRWQRFNTFSRSGLVTLILVLSAVALLLRRRTGRQPRLFLPAALLVLLLVGLQAAVSPAFAMRLTSESDNDWYLAAFEAPVEMVLQAGEERLVTITVTNEGAFTWRSEAVLRLIWRRAGSAGKRARGYQRARAGRWAAGQARRQPDHTDSATRP